MGEAVMQALPEGYALTLEEEPPGTFRAELAQRIHAFHAGTIAPWSPRRFGIAVRDAEGALRAGLSGLLAWEWLFIEAVFVDEALRGSGIGRAMLARAEDEAKAAGCRGAWLDTFLAQGFYAGAGYAEFGALPDYPAGFTRHFLCKRFG